MSPSHPDPKVDAYIAGFPDEQPLPLDLIRRIVEWRVGEVGS